MTGAKMNCYTINDLSQWARLVFRLKDQLPVTMSWRPKADRSLDQNALAWKWAQEISVQRGDMEPFEVHGFNKLHFGVPIRRENDDFRERYDAIIRPLPYEQKLACMVPPIDLPVTRDMGVRQMTRFLDATRDHWTREGVVLTMPEEA